MATPGLHGLKGTDMTVTRPASAPDIAPARVAAVLLYRLASFWLVAFAGWLVLLCQHLRLKAAGAGQACRTPRGLRTPP